MTIRQIIHDLTVNKMQGSHLFRTKLFKSKKDKAYQFRSFADLFHYYRLKGVSELLLVEALKQGQFNIFYCADINRLVIWKPTYTSNFITRDDAEDCRTCDKYTIAYLENLVKQLNNKQ